MITIKRKLLGLFELYSIQEALEKGIPLDKHWSLAEKGDWIVTDDNLVAQCIRVSSDFVDKRGYRRRQIAYPFGKLWVTFHKGGGSLMSPRELLARPYIKARAYNRTAPITFGQEILNTRKWNRFFEVYSQMIVEGKASKESLMKLAGHFCRKHSKPYLAIKVVLRQKEVKKKMEELVVKKMVELGIPDPKSYAIDLLKKAAVIAEKDRNPDAMIKVAKEFNLLLDAYPKKLQQLGQIEMVSVRQLDANIEKEEAKLLSAREEPVVIEGEEVPELINDKE